MFETMLSVSPSTLSSIPKLQKEREIMRRSSVNPFMIIGMSGLSRVQEETEEHFQVNSNPFSIPKNTQSEHVYSKPSISSTEEEVVSNPFAEVANPFKMASNPFSVQKKSQISHTKSDSDEQFHDNLLERLSLKIEVKDKTNKLNQSMLFLDEQQKLKILNILRPHLKEELQTPNTEMVIKINSRKNSLEKEIVKGSFQVKEIPEETESDEDQEEEKDNKEANPFKTNSRLQEKLVHENIIMEVEKPMQEEIEEIVQISSPTIDFIENQNIMDEDSSIQTEEKNIGSTNPNLVIEKTNIQIERTANHPFRRTPQSETIQLGNLINQNTFHSNSNITSKNPTTYSTHISAHPHYNYSMKPVKANQYEVVRSYHKSNSNQGGPRNSEDFKLKSVIRNIKTIKRVSHQRSQINPNVQKTVNKYIYSDSNAWKAPYTPKTTNLHLNKEEENFNLAINKTQFPLNHQENSYSMRDSGFQNETDRYLNGNSFVQMESNQIHESQVITPKMHQSINQNNIFNIDSSVYQQNSPFYRRNNEVNYTNQVHSNFETVSKDLTPQNNMKFPSPKNLNMTKTDVARTYEYKDHQVISNIPRTPKIKKKSVTSGLKIFKRVKDSQGNYVKQNMAKSINLYCENILSQIRRPTEEANYNHIPTTHRMGHPIKSNRVIANNYFSGNRIVQSGNKTQNSSQRNSKDDLHYVKSSRVSPIYRQQRYPNQNIYSDGVYKSEAYK